VSVGPAQRVSKTCTCLDRRTNPVTTAVKWAGGAMFALHSGPRLFCSFADKAYSVGRRNVS